MLLEIRDVHVEYGPVRAVSGVDVSVDHGEIVSVIGANGAGKSSLLGGVLGLSPMTRGSISFEGVDMSAWPPPRRVRSGVVLVPEGRRILVSLTVEENLLMGAYHRTDRQGIADDLAWIYRRFPNLLARRDLLGAVLSGGEQQMLAIGRAIMARPKLMLLDEPSLGLSPLIVDEVFSIILELSARNISILLVEQNTQLALECSTRSYVLTLGTIVRSGQSKDLARMDDLFAAYLTKPQRPGENRSTGINGSFDSTQEMKA
ncbi:MAG: branched-chain amino acid transport system ATP-binding protein [Bradyrhizobium sp.]|jgi:branched-chain amino acid transport system ATP-binding protein|nr:branched-chain amino acid transport system ATP-binding protein [Bradyrhizobium sp.]